MKLIVWIYFATHVLEGFFLLLQPLVCGQQLLLSLFEVILKLLHLLLEVTDFLLSLNQSSNLALKHGLF